MSLRSVVEKYLQLAGGFGQPIPLAAFGFSREETERLFSIFDEDYQISRFVHFSDATGESFLINGFSHTHVIIDASIQTVL